MSFYKLPSIRDVNKAARLISHTILETPVMTSEGLSEVASSHLRAYTTDSPSVRTIELFFKCENFQRTGSFKFRGASHFLAKLKDHELANGVVAYSTGNHAQAVAHAAQIASRRRNIPIPAFVVVPENCSRTKVNAAKTYGAEVLLSGTSPESRVRLAQEIQKSTGAVLVPPADDLNIALGQATAIPEFLHQVEDLGCGLLDAVIVPSGGGGLLVGAVAAARPQGVIIFGAEPECGGPRLAEAIQRGMRSNQMESGSTVADGLRSLTGEANWEHIRNPGNVDQVFSVSEEHILEALRLAVEVFGFAIEPSAAVPLAVALFSPDFHRRIAREQRSVKVGVVLTGGNVSGEDLLAMLPGVEIEG